MADDESRRSTNSPPAAAATQDAEGAEPADAPRDLDAGLRRAGPHLGRARQGDHAGRQLLKLGRGTVVELDRKVGEAIDIYVNNRLVARGEVVVVDDRLGVTMTEIIKDGDAQRLRPRGMI